MLGLVVQNRFTRRYRRVCGEAAGRIFLREIGKDGRLKENAIVLRWWVAGLLYRARYDLVAPWDGVLKKL